MMIRKIVLAAGAAALMSSTAWATPSDTHGHQGTAHSHRCQPHRVGYVAAGLLDSQTLTLDPSGKTYSGDVTVDVKRTNHAAAGDKGNTVTYTVANVHVRFGLPDANDDDEVGLDDVQAGARVRVIGKVTKLAKRCDQSSFTPETTIRRIVFHAPPAAKS